MGTKSVQFELFHIATCTLLIWLHNYWHVVLHAVLWTVNILSYLISVNQKKL